MQVWRAHHLRFCPAKSPQTGFGIRETNEQQPLAHGLPQKPRIVADQWRRVAGVSERVEEPRRYALCRAVVQHRDPAQNGHLR